MGSKNIYLGYLEFVERMHKDQDIEELNDSALRFKDVFISISHPISMPKRELLEQLIRDLERDNALSGVGVASTTRRPAVGILWRFFGKRYAATDIALRLGIAEQKHVLRRPPGSGLNAIAEFIYSKRTYERVFQPTVGDLQDEYMATLANGRVWKARWVWVRGHATF